MGSNRLKTTPYTLTLLAIILLISCSETKNDRNSGPSSNQPSGNETNSNNQIHATDLIRFIAKTTPGLGGCTTSGAECPSPTVTPCRFLINSNSAVVAYIEEKSDLILAEEGNLCSTPYSSVAHKYKIKVLYNLAGITFPEDETIEVIRVSPPDFYDPVQTGEIVFLGLRHFENQETFISASSGVQIFEDEDALNSTENEYTSNEYMEFDFPTTINETSEVCESVMRSRFDICDDDIARFLDDDNFRSTVYNSRCD